MFTSFQTLQGDPRFHRFTFGVAEMPKWARLILLICMVPGIMLVVLSIFIVIGSILALLLLTVPVYQLLKWVTGVRAAPPGVAASGTKRVQATVRDA
jgi:Co/Zn/Cd efflux system component